MNLSELFIRRPVTTVLVMLGILFFGVTAYKRLPVSDLPTVDYPTLTVSASLPGASPETMASAVATPLEKQFSTIAGIDNMTSTSALGSCNITIQFTLDRNIDAAAQDVQAMIAKTLKNLPPGIIPPSYQKVNPADQPIVFYGFTSTLMPISELDKYAETFMAQRISMIPGVAQVNVYGSAKYAVRIQLDPNALASRQIGIDEVADAVNNQNVNLPTGVLNGPTKTYTVQANGQLDNAASFRRLVVTYRNGAPIHLGDIGQVLDDIQNNKSIAWFSENGESTRGVILAIQRQPGTNTVAVADAVKEEMTKLQKQIPASVNMTLMYDRAATIRQSVRDVKLTLVLTLCLVIAVIFLFLRNVSATLIPSLALPISVIGTFAVMYLLDYSLDNLSLMALTLAVGFVVDDAIVMLENIVRHMEMGKPPMRAAMDGAAEVGFTILSMTISLTAVFIPILFLGGIVGRLFHEFAVVIAVSILVSGFVSLTLTPMLSSRFLRPHEHDEKHGRAYQITEAGYDWLLAKYKGSLEWVMIHRPLAMAFSFAILVGTVVLFILVPKGFIPSQDNGQLFVTTETAQGTSFDDMAAHQMQVNEILRADTNIAGFYSAIGGSSTVSGTNQGRLLIGLKPRAERVNVDEMIKELRPKLAKIPGIVVYMQNPPPIQIGGRVSKSLYQFTMQSSDITTLYPAADALVAQARKSPLLQDVTTDLQLGNPQASVEIDRERAAQLGVSAGQIETALYDAYGSRQVSTIYTPNDEFWVVMELLPQYQLDLSAMNMLYIRSNTGALVPLSGVARITQTAGALSVNHSGQLPSVTLSFNLRPGVALGQATDEVQSIANKTLPSSISTGFSGTAQAFQSTQAGMLALLGIAIFVIYVVLGVLYESFIHPITILSGLPFAAFGALLTLLVFKIDLSVYAFVGIILLVGLVKKNAIMMIDFALEAERSEGRAPADAIVHACLIRFRPIMMTTMAALMGTLPIAVSTGAGSESRRPLGIAVVGGLAFSQLITLYVTPVFYTYMDALSERGAHFFARFGKKKRVDDGHAPVPVPVPATANLIVVDGQLAKSGGDAAD
jgi:HAE1 family hydrophobic/amphiphilic exporter-1